tara:strand:- start:310 stop:534 length:225 start_codon:yes stop_codon:yes gene_type:complete
VITTIGRKLKMARPKKQGYSERVELLRTRYESGQDIWTGNDLENEDLAEWQLIMGLREAERIRREGRELATHSA